MLCVLGKRSTFCLTGLLLGIFGLGFRGRNIIHWFLFAFVTITASWRLYGLFTNFRMYLIHISDIFYMSSALLQIVLSFKRAKSFGELLSNSNKLCKKNYVIFRVVDVIVSMVVLSQFINDMGDGLWKDRCYASFHVQYSYMNRKSVIANITIATVCIHREILIRYSDMFCGLYLLMFVIVYFIKVEQLQSISNCRTSALKVRVWAISSQVSALHEKFEDTSCIILLDRTIYQFSSILKLFPVLMTNIRTRHSLGFGGIFFDTLGYFHDMFVTVSVLLAVSLMQESIKRKCRCVSDQILFADLFCGTNNEGRILINILESKFTQKVTIGKVAKVSRSLIISLASTFVAFSILFWQVNNGALGHSDDQKS